MTKPTLMFPLDDVLDAVTRKLTEHCAAKNQSVTFSVHLLDKGLVMLRAAMTDIETDAQWFFETNLPLLQRLGPEYGFNELKFMADVMRPE